MTEVVLIEKAWLGVDAGKESHWARMLDASGTELLSRKVENDEADLSKCRTLVSSSQVNKSSPNCSFFSDADVTSSPTRAGPSLA